jgi:hypothetical protein
MRGFVQAYRGEAAPLTSARESLESHLLAYAAEQSRLSQRVVEMAAYREAADQTTPDVPGSAER